MDEQVRKKTLSYSIKDGVAWSVSNALGPSYIAPYALALGANNVQIGLLTYVPTLAANLSQVPTPKLMERTSRKRIVTISSLIQALMLLPIASVALLFPLVGVKSLIAPTLVIILYTVYLLIAYFPNPAWSSWMGDLVLRQERGRFFGRRNAILGIASISAMLLGGIFLSIFSPGYELFVFEVIFLIAAAAMLVSWYFQTKEYEPRFKYKEEFYFTFSSFVKRMKDNNFGKFTIYVTLILFAQSINGPFLAVYLIKELRFSYFVYVSIILSGSITQVITMGTLGKFSDRYGNLLLLRICGMLVPATAILTLFSPSPIYLLGVQALSGVLWGGFNLASSNYIYDCVTRQRLGICFSYFGALNGVGVFLGATLGSLIATYVNVGFMSTLLFLFLVSGILRLMFSLIMLPKLREVRKAEAPKPLWYHVAGIVRKRIPLHPH
jgi:MFS family permease